MVMVDCSNYVRTCPQFVLPYLLGWHTFANSIKPEDANRQNSTNATNPRSADFEWTR